MKSSILPIVILFILLQAAPGAAQNSVTYYMNKEGKLLTETQVDSLKDLYGDKLSLIKRMQRDTAYVRVLLPGEEPQISNSSIRFGEVQLGSDGEIKVIYLDRQGNEISEDQFREIAAESGQNIRVKQEIREGQRYQIFTLPAHDNPLPVNSTSVSSGSDIENWIGKPFPSRDWKDVYGNEISPSDLEGKIVVVNFWFVECMPCIKEMPELNTLVESYKNRDDILFIAPALNDSNEILKMLQTRPFDYKLIPDQKGLTEDMGVQLYPTHMVVNRNGRIAFIETGAKNTIREILDTYIKTLL